MSEHSPRSDDLAAYALGALDSGDVADLERHLAGCEQCRSELRELEMARDVLPAAVPPMKPPRALKRRLMASVDADARASRGAASAPGYGWAARAAAGFAAASVLAVAVVVAVESGEDPTVIAAQPTGTTPTRIAATLELDDEQGTLRVSRLPVLGRGQAYQLWIQRDGVMHPSTVFTLEPDGTKVTAVDGSLGDAEALVLTREPLEGRATPTSGPLLEVPLEA